MYQLDGQAARQADRAGAFINEIGKYVGTFTQAVDVTAKTGTKGIAFQFESDGQRANLPIYTMRSNGEKIMGFQVLSAIMTCLQLRQISEREGAYKEYDFDAKADVEKRGNVFPDLCNKPIGLLLETEDYLNGNGDPRKRMVITGVFQASTELTASEILDKKTKPEQLEKLVARLRHRPLKGGAKQASNYGPPAGHPASGGGGFADMDDDIPFANPLRSRALCLAC